MKCPIEIGDKWIGEERRVFIVAEAGVNHNGDLVNAKKLVDAAIFAGADAVKFQTFKTEDLTTKETPMAKYQEKNTGIRGTQNELLKKLELTNEEFIELKNYCDRKRIIFLSTPHTFEAIDFLDPIVPCFKFGSADLTNLPALKHAAKKGKPIILGTGMSTLGEVEDAVKAVKDEGNNRIIALHCTSNYPCPMEEVNIRAIVSMREKLDCLIGFSDHTLGNTASIMAVTLGAVLIEKHYTLDRTQTGPDHKASMEPHELKCLIKELRDVQKAIGSGVKEPASSENEAIRKARKSLVAAIDILEGSVLTRDMISIKRPGTGIDPAKLDLVIGKKTRGNINKDDLIEWDLLY